MFDLRLSATNDANTDLSKSFSFIMFTADIKSTSIHIGSTYSASKAPVQEGQLTARLIYNAFHFNTDYVRMYINIFYNVVSLILLLM